MLCRRVERFLQGRSEEDAPESGAIDIKVGGKHPVLLRCNAAYRARLVEKDLVDVAVKVLHPALGYFLAEECLELERIEVKRGGNLVGLAAFEARRLS